MAEYVTRALHWCKKKSQDGVRHSPSHLISFELIPQSVRWQVRRRTHFMRPLKKQLTMKTHSLPKHHAHIMSPPQSQHCFLHHLKVKPLQRRNPQLMYPSRTQRNFPHQLKPISLRRRNPSIMLPPHSQRSHTVLLSNSQRLRIVQHSRLPQNQSQRIVVLVFLRRRIWAGKQTNNKWV